MKSETETNKTQPLTIRANALWILASNAIYALCLWLIFILITRWGGLRAAGDYALSIAVCTPLLTFCNLHLRSIQATDAQGLYSFRTYRRLRFLALPLASSILAAAILFCPKLWALRSVLSATFAALAIDALSDIYYGRFQRRERLDWIACSLISRGSLGLLAFAFFYHRTQRLALSLSTVAMANALVFLCYDRPRSRRLSDTPALPAPGDSRRLLRLSLPLGLMTLILSLQYNLPRYLLEAYGGAESLAIYAAFLYLAGVGDMAVRALGDATSPRLAAFFRQGDEMAFTAILRRTLWLALGVGLAMGLLFAVAGKPLLLFLYGPAHAAQHRVLLIIASAYLFLFLSNLLGVAATARWLFQEQLWLNGLLTLWLFIAGLLLIPRYGISGAAIALWLTALCGLAAFAWLLTHHRRGKKESR